MPTMTDDDRDIHSDEQDRPYNASALNDSESAAFDNISANYDKTADDSQENANIKRARANEEAPEWKNQVGKNTSGQKNSSNVISKILTRKNSSLFAIIIAVIGGGGGLLTLLTPGLAVLQLQEVLRYDLDDVTSALDLRTEKILKTRIKTNLGTVGLCAGKVTVKCKFSTMSKRQINKLQKAGVEVDCNGTCTGLRSRPTKLTFSDGTSLDNANQISKFMRENPTARNQFIKAFNPKYYSWASIATNKAFSILGINKAKKLIGTSKEKISESLNKVVNRKGTTSIDGVPLEQQSDGSYKDAAGNSYDASAVKASQNVTSKISEIKTKISSTRGFGAAIKGAGLVGSVDTACTIVQTSRAFSLVAKAIRNQKLVGYAFAILTSISALRAGDATPEEIEYIGNTFTNIDTRETLGTDEDGNAIVNKSYGKSGFDSPLYKLSAYNEVPNMSTVSPTLSDFMVGGTGAGVLSSIYEASKKAIGGDINTTCGLVQNNIVRGGSLILGVAAASTGVGVIKLVGTAVGGMAMVNLAMGYLESMIVEQAEDIDVETYMKYGPDAFAATWAGYSTGTGQVAAASGLTPVTDESFASYIQTKAETDQKYTDIAVQEARSTPFDVSNQYSFLGKLARTTSSIVNTNKNNLTTLSSLIPQSFSLLFSDTTARATATDTSRFEQCNDDEYAALGIKADVMCNIRFTLTSKQLSLEADEVADWMIDNGYINNDASETADLTLLVTSNENGALFTKYLEHCAYRETPYGSQGEENENDWDTGKACLGTSSEISSSTLDYFRTFTADYTLIQAMDYENSSASTSNTESIIASVTGNAQELAQAMLDNPNISLSTGSWNSSGVSPKQQIENIAAGKQPIPGYNQTIDPKLLQALATLGNSHKITISSLLRSVQTAGGYSVHPSGMAADISLIDGSITTAAMQKAIDITEPIISQGSDAGNPCAFGTLTPSSMNAGKCKSFYDDGTGPHLHIGIKYTNS